MNGPVIIAQHEKWRIVRVVDGERVTYILEKHDGFDALACERWKEVRLGEASVDSITRQMRDFIIQQAVKAEKEQTT
jgi:hypothetical protein